MVGDSVTLDLITSNKYSKLPFSNATDSVNEAERYAMRFMLLNKEVFGYNDFLITDNRLFNKGLKNKDTSKTRKYVSLKSKGVGTRISGRMQYIETCVDITTIAYHCGTPDYPGCDDADGCDYAICSGLCYLISTSTQTICDGGWYDDGTGSTSGGSGTTSGGGGTGSPGTVGTTTTDPCLVSRIIAARLPCEGEGGSGWTPVDDGTSSSTFVAGITEPGLDLDDFLKCFDNTSGSKYEITVDIDQPVPGTRITYTKGNAGSSGTSSKGGDIDVGHTFLTLIQTKPDGTMVTRVLGFYPENSVSPISPSSAGAFLDDSKHHFDVSITSTVDNNAFSTFISVLKSSEGTTYNLNSTNCTSLCTSKLKLIGINLPETEGTWPLGKGINPADLGEDIRAMSLQPNQSKNVLGGAALNNIGTCQ